MVPVESRNSTVDDEAGPCPMLCVLHIRLCLLCPLCRDKADTVNLHWGGKTHREAKSPAPGHGAHSHEDIYPGSRFWKGEACVLPSAGKCHLPGLMRDSIVLQATPDLLKGQQELSQRANEETAKQILYNYLKEG